MKKSDFVISFGQRMLLLLCVFTVCFVLTAACSYLLGRFMPERPQAALRISAVVQDLLCFIIPAILTALLSTRRPAAMLCLLRRPSLIIIFLIASMLLVSIPVQEAVIYWNYHLSLPSAMQGIEEAARQMEHTAFVTLRTLLSDTSVPALIVNMLIIGVAAGFAEELFFRGCFQRILTTAGVNIHVAVWSVAICFSAMHFQLFGFVPRMLLGAYFGYLLVWTKSIWVPILAHILNNMMFVLTAWHQIKTDGIDTLSNEPTLWGLAPTLISVGLIAAVLFLMRRFSVGTKD